MAPPAPWPLPSPPAAPRAGRPHPGKAIREGGDPRGNRVKGSRSQGCLRQPPPFLPSILCPSSSLILQKLLLAVGTAQRPNPRTARVFLKFVIFGLHFPPFHFRKSP